MPAAPDKWSWRKSFDTAIGYAKTSRAVRISGPYVSSFVAHFSAICPPCSLRFLPFYANAPPKTAENLWFCSSEQREEGSHHAYRRGYKRGAAAAGGDPGSGDLPGSGAVFVRNVMHFVLRSMDCVLKMMECML